MTKAQPSRAATKATARTMTKSKPARAAAPDVRLPSVRRLRVTTRAQLLAEVIAPGVPVILEGALARWPWKRPDALLRRLRQLAGHRTVMTSWAPVTNDGLLSYAERDGTGKTWTDAPARFATFLDDIEAAARAPGAAIRYLQSAVIGRELPELAPLFPMPLLAEAELRQQSPRLWIGSGGHRVGLHYDVDDNLHCVVAGGKRFLLYPPSSLPDVYLGALDASPAGAPTALVDPLRPDLRAYPRFAAAAARAQVAELAPGDALYLPAYWLHHVESRGVNVAVNYWWSELSADERAAAESAWTHGLLALRNLPPRWRERYHLLFAHFVFQAHGDPYAHLPVAEQGRAGAPTPERTRALRDQLRRELSRARLLEAAFDASARHVLAKGTSFRVIDEDSLELARPGGDPLVVPAELFAIVRRFHAPATVEEMAVAHCGKGARHREARARFAALCKTLVARGVLLPAG